MSKLIRNLTDSTYHADQEATCFDHNFVKSTNFSASRPSWNAELRDLALGAKSNFQIANFHAEISRNFSKCVVPTGWLTKLRLRATVAQEKLNFKMEIDLNFRSQNWSKYQEKRI